MVPAQRMLWSGKNVPIPDGLGALRLLHGDSIAGIAPRGTLRSGGPRRSTAGRLTAYPNGLRPSVLAGREFERYHLARVQRPHSRALDIAVVNEEVAVHRFALDVPPSVLEPRHNAGVPGPSAWIEGVLCPVARSID
jgi:hypothetical protein